MARECEVCFKKTTAGRQYTHRGLAKHVGGVGIKITGITRRTFRPNVQKIRVQMANGTVRRMKVCTSCIRAGKVKKPVRREIPEGLKVRMRAKEEAKTPAARKRRAAEAGKRRRERKAVAAKRAAAKA
ncbi:MAG TPA: 50S ribosomal protein L28 [Planctomycetes bacterium]|nr:50S ribosomal protein L28 [Planctomycetota bacterium]